MIDKKKANIISIILDLITGGLATLIMLILIIGLAATKYWDKHIGGGGEILFILPLFVGISILVINILRIKKSFHKGFTIAALVLNLVEFVLCLFLALGLIDVRWTLFLIIPALTAAAALVFSIVTLVKKEVPEAQTSKPKTASRKIK